MTKKEKINGKKEKKEEQNLQRFSFPKENKVIFANSLKEAIKKLQK